MIAGSANADVNGHAVNAMIERNRTLPTTSSGQQRNIVAGSRGQAQKTRLAANFANKHESEPRNRIPISR
jgi:hypothetical protein